MKLKTIFYVLQSKLISPFYKTPNVLSDFETVEYIKKTGCGIARFGDGELALMQGFSIPFQDKNNALAKRLKNIKTTKNCLACVPNVFDLNALKQTTNEEEFNFWKKNLNKFLGLWKKLFGKCNVVGDAFLSRFYMRKTDKSQTAGYASALKEIWQDREIIFVEGEKSRLGVGNDLFSNSKDIKRIICPSKNAFESYEKILSAVKKSAKKDSLIIVALGPTATVLAYDLCGLGYQALDLGHVDVEYEWFKMGATKKCPVKNKQVIEIGSDGLDENGTDLTADKNKENAIEQDYIAQIIERI